MSRPVFKNPILVTSFAIALAAAIAAPLFAELHVYRVKSAYSGKDFWVSYSRLPSEENILDSLIYRDPLIKDPEVTTSMWRRARTEGTAVHIKKDADSSIVVMPYDASSDPDTVFPDGRRVKGIWLTEPSTRSKLPVTLVGTGYAVGSFVVFGIGSFSVLSFIRWGWYFLLRRITELVSAFRTK